MSVDTVTEAVVKRTDAGTRKVFLGGLDKALVVFYLAEVPTFAVEVDRAAVDVIFSTVSSESSV